MSSPSSLKHRIVEIDRLQPNQVYELPPTLGLTPAQEKQCRWSAYSSELVLHANLLDLHANANFSRHLQRTFDPAEADVFFVPLFPACFLFNCWTEGGGWDLSKRCRVDEEYILPILSFVKGEGYWKSDREGVRNHIIAHPMDRGDDYYEPATIAAMRNNTIYLITSGDKRPAPFSQHLQPTTDIIIPSATHLLHSYHIDPRDYLDSAGRPLATSRCGTTDERSVKVIFRGGGASESEGEAYSLGIRDLFYPTEMHPGFSSLPSWSIAISSSNGEYAAILARSQYGLVPPGYTLDTTRLYEYLAFGVVPVFLGAGSRGGQQLPFEADVDYEAFSVFVSREQVHRLPQILHRITEEERKRLQRGVWGIGRLLVLDKKEGNAWKFIARELCRRGLGSTN